MPPARIALRGTSVGLATGLALSLLAVSPAAASPVVPEPDGATSHDTASPAEPTAFHDQEVDWALCEEEIFAEFALECARVEVPLDYADPDGERIEIAILRVPASDPQARRGVIFSNPGGPGAPGRALALELGLGPTMGLGNSRSHEVYDHIGMDPRGTGASTPVDCQGELPFTYPRPTDSQISEVTRETIRYTRQCDANAGDLRPHMTTANTARDMDVIRAALGEERINYVGYSYGTYLGAVYGSLFPERLDRSVLDSPVHPDGIWRESFMMQATAYTENVERYAIWLSEHDAVFGLGEDPDQILRAFEETADALQEEPRTDHPVETVYDGNTFALEVGLSARYQQDWDVSAWHLKDVIEGEPFPEVGPAIMANLEPEVTEDEDVLFGFAWDLHTAILCEAEWPNRLSVYHSDMRDHRENHPYGTGAHWAGPQTCTFSSGPGSAPEVDLAPAGTTDPLIIAGEYDANTAYSGGPAMAEALDGSLVTVTDDGGHGFYGMVDLLEFATLHPCVNEAVDAYLVDGANPRDLECAGLPRPDVNAERPDTQDLAELFQRFQEFDETEPVRPGALGRD